jgi:hypothetical protein
VGSFDVEPPFDVVAGQAPDLAGGEVRQRRQLAQLQGHIGVGYAEAAPARQHDGGVGLQA